jgi:hypothetical protein
MELCFRQVARRLVLALAGVALVGGCSSRPASLESVAIDGASAADGAIAHADANGDQALDDAELAKIPGMLKQKEKYDLDGNGLVSKQEIHDRINLWATQGLGVKTLGVEVTLDGRPLPDAKVTFVPEPFLGEGPKVAAGVTDANGMTKVSVANEDLPEQLQQARLRGLYGGIYRIEVTHPQRAIPSRYNTATTLGEEIARDAAPDRVKLDLRSR